MNLTQRIAFSLVSELRNASYHVFLDNLFSSPELFRAFRAVGVGASGIARQNSGIFEELIALKKEKDSSKPWGWIKAIPTEDSLINQFA